MKESLKTIENSTSPLTVVQKHSFHLKIFCQLVGNPLVIDLLTFSMGRNKDKDKDNAPGTTRAEAVLVVPLR